MSGDINRLKELVLKYEDMVNEFIAGTRQEAYAGERASIDSKIIIYNERIIKYESPQGYF